MTGWPIFKLTVLPEDALDASIRGSTHVERLKNGVPVDLLGGRYAAADRLMVVSAHRGDLVQFGTGLNLPICLDPKTNEVVSVAADGLSTSLVNSSFERFTETVSAVTSRFPFYGLDSSDDDVEAATRNVADMIRRIDESAMVPDRFWSTLVDDIGMGDFVTEWIVAGRVY
jgi:hypothetical protein